jgi:hypothetical protein
MSTPINYGLYEGPEGVGLTEPNPVLGYRVEPITQEELKDLSDEEKRVKIIKRANFFYLWYPRTGDLAEHIYKQYINKARNVKVPGVLTIFWRLLCKLCLAISVRY